MNAALRSALFALLLLMAGNAKALCLGPLCNCSVTTTNLAFGVHQPIAGTATDSSGTVSVSCGGVAGLLIPYRVDLGAGGSGNILARRMASGGNTLNYGLYNDAGRTTVWGDTVTGTPVNGSILLSVLGSAPAVAHTVYGRIPSGQTATVPGAYTDTLTITLTYY